MILNLICSATIMINLTSFPWNSHDTKVKKRAIHVCKTNVRYRDEFPCLKKFIKKGKRDFTAICGKPKNGQ